MDDSNSLRETFDCVGPGYPVEPRSKTEAPCIRTRHSVNVGLSHVEPDPTVKSKDLTLNGREEVAPVI